MIHLREGYSEEVEPITKTIPMLWRRQAAVIGQNHMMLFNPITNCLFSTDRVLIKRLICLEDVRWDDMTSTEETEARNCEHCSRRVQDIKYMSEEDVINQIKRDPKTCLKLKLDYENIRVVMLDD